MAGVVIALCAGLLLAAPAVAQPGPAAPNPTCNSDPPTAPPPPGQPAPALPPGNVKLTVAIDAASVWRPALGEVRFTISGPGFSPNNMQLLTCFSWPRQLDRRDANTWQEGTDLRLVSTGTQSATYLVTMPKLVAPADPWWARVLGRSRMPSTAAGLVPLADFRLVAKGPPESDWSYLDVVQPMGVTSGFMALVVTLTVVILAWAILYLFGRLRHVPGTGDPVLQLISTKSGYASLSQLQILLWAFVVGGSAVYVMVLSGNLIEISQGTLILLGISGVATLGSKLQSTASPNGGSEAAPGQVQGLDHTQPAGESDVRLSWAAPATGGPADTYTVLYRRTDAAAPAEWRLATATLRTPRLRVVGLDSDAPYAFRVFGVNSGGPGQPSDVAVATAAEPPGAIGPVPAFRLEGPAKNTSLKVAWDAVPNAAYRLEYRRHDSDADWTYAAVSGLGGVIHGLEADTFYDLRVAAAAPPPGGGEPVFGRWTTLSLATAGPRNPQWSDLVVENDGANEIDVTRVQMLFFTVVVATFVVLRVLTSGEIPAIPDGFLLLMGISNGVYLGSKFIPS